MEIVMDDATLFVFVGVLLLLLIYASVILISNLHYGLDQEEEPMNQPYKVFTKYLTEIPNMSNGKAYYINEDVYKGTFICDSVYMCSEDFYPHGMEIHMTIIKGEEHFEYRFGSKLVICVGKSVEIEPAKLSDNDKRLLKIIRG